MDESNQTRRDSELLANFVSHRDEDSFEALVDKYLPLVLGVAIRRTGSRAIAEEIAQNVFTLLAQKARRLRSHPTIGGWLMKTTAFESMRANEKEQTRRRNMNEFQDELRVPTVDLPGSDVEWKEAKAILDEALSSLSDGDRDVIVMRFYEDKSFKAIAQIVGRSDDACQKRVTRALERLHKAMRRRGAVIPLAALGTGLTAELGRAASSVRLAKSITGSVIGSTVREGAATTLTLTQLMASINSKAGVAVSAILLLAVAAIGGFTTGRAGGNSGRLEAGEIVGGPRSAGASGVRGDAGTARVASEDIDQLLREIVRRARLDLQQADWNPGMEARAAWRISKIHPRHVRRAIELAEIRSMRFTDSELLNMLLGHWTKSDGTAAFEFLAEKADGPVHGWISLVFRRQVTDWAMEEPQSAIDRIVRWGAETETRNRVQAKQLESSVRSLTELALKSWSQHDLAGAVAAFLKLDEQNQAGYKGEISRGEGLVHSMDLLGSIRVEDPSDLGTKGNFGSRWARQRPQEFADWLDQHAVTHYSDTSRLHPRLLDVWLRHDPRAASDWWIGRETKAGKATQIGQLIKSWTEFDVASAAEWLSGQSGGAEIDQGVAKLAARIAPDDPRAALAWVIQIEDVEARRNALREVADLSDRSGSGLAELDQIGLDPTDREWLLGELDREGDENE